MKMSGRGGRGGGFNSAGAVTSTGLGMGTASEVKEDKLFETSPGLAVGSATFTRNCRNKSKPRNRAAAMEAQTAQSRSSFRVDFLSEFEMEDLFIKGFCYRQ